MANSSTHSLAVPIYGAKFNLDFDYFTTGAVPTAPTALDTEVSLDGGTYADCTEEVTLYKEVGGVTDSPAGYLTLTAASMTADLVTVQSKSANCVTRIVSFRPHRIVAARTGTAQSGDATHIQLDANASAIDDFYNGMWIRTDSGTGLGQARQVLDYVGSTKTALVATWETNPSSDTTFTVGPLASASDASMSSRLAPATAGRTLVVDASGLADANMVKAGPTGSGSAQTARDLGANLDVAVSSRGTSTYTGADTAGTTTLLGIFTGITSLAKWLRGLARKDAMDATAKTELNLGGGTFDEAEDSNEAIRDTAPLGAVMRGTDGAMLASSYVAPDNADIAAIKADYARRTGDYSTLAAGAKMDIVDVPNSTALTAIAKAIWDAATSGMTAIGSIGKKLADWVTGRVDSYNTNQDPATLLLVTPANKLATDATGRVTVGSNADKTGYSLTVSPPTASVIAAAVHDLDMAGYEADAVEGTKFGNFVALMRANMGGKIAISGEGYTLYEADGATVIATYTINATGRSAPV